MTVYIQFDDVVLDLNGQPPVEETLLEQAARAALTNRAVLTTQAALAAHPPEAQALTLVLTGDEAIQELNRQYLGFDSPTDVLSFPAGEVDPETQEFYLGDVILSYPRAQAQAAAAGHPLEAELQLLTVHGVLHLLGYDHAERQEKDLMWSEQDRILTILGCPARPPVD
jgi:probable rRNA maturation factor